MPWMDRARPIACRCALVAVVIAAAARPAAAQADAAALAVVTGEDWLGARPTSWQAPAPMPPLWQGPGAMVVEQQLATSVIRQWWPEHIADAEARAMIDGFARYLQSRVIEQAFDLRYLRQAHSAESLPNFGGHVVWSLPPVRRSRQSVIEADRHAAVFAALEKWIGVPSLQAAMTAVARLPRNRLTAADIVKTISDAAGQDVSWLFNAVDADISYGVTNLTADSVTVTRIGSGIFAGRAAPRAGAFDSGDALQLKTVFADGTSVMTTWDGRDSSRTFHFQGRSPVVAAYLDPDGIVTLDRDRLDNSVVTPSPTNVPVGKWVARWIVWLQHTMLSYGSLA